MSTLDLPAFRKVLARALGTDEGAVDRIAAALGLRDGRPGIETVTPCEGTDDFPGGPVFTTLLDDPSKLASAVARGLSLLAEGFDTYDGDVFVLLSSLLAGRGSEAGQDVAGGSILPLTVELGTLDGSPVRWTVNREAGRRTNANLRIAGGQGKGKTQFLEHVLASVAEGAPDVGLLVLDYKGDLSRDAAFVEATGATVIRPQDTPVPINPFEVPSGVRRALVAMEVATLLRSVATGMGAVQQELVRQAVEAAYVAAGTTGEGAPTAQDIAHAVETAYEEAQREPDTVTAWLTQLAKLGLFSERDRGSAEEFLRRRWIIDLSGLGALRGLVAFVLLHWVQRQTEAFRDAPIHAGGLRALRSIVAVDEAHHYLKARCEPLLALLRIGRSKGLPVFLSSQSLTDFREYTETDELFGWTIVLGHGGKPEARTLQAALGLSSGEAQRAADKAVELEQFMAMVPADADGPRPPIVRLHTFFERHRTQQGDRT